MPRNVAFTCSLLLCALAAPAQDADTVRRFRELNEQATAAYQEQDWAKAVEGFSQAADLIPDSSVLYNLACCHALAGTPDAALDALEQAVTAGFMDTAHAKQDADLSSLRELPRFAEILGQIKPLTDAREVLKLQGDAELSEVPWFVNLPAEHDPQGSYPVVLALPPGPGTEAMVHAGLQNYWKAGKQRGYLVISVQLQGQRFQGRAAKVLEPILAAAKANYGADLERVVLAGFSNGGVGAFLALHETWKGRPFKGLAALPGLAPADLSLQTLAGLQGFPVLLRVGEGDPRWVKAMKATVAELKEAGAKLDYAVLPGQGHVLSLDTAKLFDWIDGVLGPAPAKQE